ncbi:hypothetical protein Nepgr_021374 [Nepenthes gracilis]|uniref:Protein E6 n=1 Tax=Nepenthes gracilis TaxID=150966 RepID=A0AAD3SWQ5_NEPGR|nr:hypothetical protein Nepgr_021374 [Nepenthes gracilis]
MANFSAKFLSLFLPTLLLSLQANARDSQFFSKVTRESTRTVPTTGDGYFDGSKNVQESQVPTKEDATLNKLEEQQPSFIPQTTQNGYGLYGHETGLFPPSTTDTATTNAYEQQNTAANLPHKAQFDEPLNNAYVTTTTTTDNRLKNNDNLYNMDSFETKQHDSTNSFYYKKNGGGNYSPQLQGDEFGNNYNYNERQQQQQGLSDTRFLDNGKYYPDIDAENNVGKNYGYSNARRNDYYSGNVNGYYHGDRAKFNSNPYDNGMHQGYQNREEEEFDFRP